MENIALYKIAEIIAGQSPPSSTYNQVGDGLPFFQGKADFGETYPTVRFWCSSPQKISEINDILISVRAPVGPTNINNTKACIGRGLTAIRCNNDIVSQKYLLHFLKWYEPQLVSKGNGAVFAAITQKDLKEIPVPLPPLATQKHIADILDAADALRRKTQQIVDSYDELAQSLFLEMFGDIINNSKRISKRKFSTFFESISYGASTPPEYVIEGIPFIRATNVKGGYINENGLVFISEQESKKISKCLLKESDLLIVRSGANTGDCSRINSKYSGSFAGFDIIVRIKEPYSTFFNFQLNTSSAKEVIAPLTRRAGQPHLNAKQISDLELLSPPLEDIISFNKMLILIEQQKELAKQSLAESENLFNALLQKAFKGELVPEPQPAEQAV